MSGFHETRVRQALMTVRDADVLCEMAAGWRTSIANLNAADDRIGRGIRALRDSDQFGDATRDAAIDSFREMRDYIAEQRLRLGQTARALDAAGGVLSQAAGTVRRWDTMGDPVSPGPAPVADPAAADQAPYLAAVTAHGQQTAGYDQAVAHREDEARQLMESMERVFTRSEDKIREQHGIPRDEQPPEPPEPPEPPPTWPPVGWPGPRPEPVDPGWPPLPPWPPVVDHRDPTAPGPEVGINPGPRPGHDPGVGPGPSATAGTSHTPSGAAHAASGPSTSVAGSSQGGVALQGATSTGAPGSFVGAQPASATGSAGMAGLSGMAGTMGSAAGRAGSAAAGRAGAGAGGATRAGSGRGAGTGASGRSGPGGKGSQQASGSARSARTTKPATSAKSATSAQAGKSSAKSGRSGTAGGAGGRGGRRKDRSRAPDVFTSGEHWLEGEDTSPDVLR